METQIGTHIQIRSSFSGGKGVSVRRNSYTNSAKTQSANVDTFAMSSPSEPYSSLSKETMEQLRRFSEDVKNCKQLEPLFPEIATDTDEGKVEFNFKLIGLCEKAMNEDISKRLEEAGVPKDVTFEFEFDFDSKDIEITGISDEKYRESVDSVLKGGVTLRYTVISCASRVMNGYTASLYYPWISEHLDRCFEQDISDLYIDENGNLGGVNENLQAAINAEKKAEKKGEYFSALQEFDFPVNNIEAIVKQLVKEENITPNISHMGYDGEQIYTNDGEFKFGKDFDPDLFGEEKYVMRGKSALYITVYGHTNSWLKNYDKFY